MRNLLEMYTVLVLLLAPAVRSQQPKSIRTQADSPVHGVFVGELELKPLDDGRNMKVLKDFAYTDWQGHTLTAKAGFISDGATIPPAVWSLVGGPWDGQYRKAAVVHDVGCNTHKYTWRDTHRLFFEAMIDSGVKRSLALTLYYGVLVGGPRWNVVATSSANTSEALDKNISSELDKLTKTEQKNAIIEKTTTKQNVGNIVVETYSGTIALPTSTAEVSESELKALENELNRRTAAGETVSTEEIERRSEKPY